MSLRPALFVNPKSALLPWPSPPRAVEPLGLLCTAASFRRSGVETHVLDLDINATRSELVRNLGRGDYGVVGIAMTSQMQVWGAFSVAQDVKSICPTAEVIVGGVYATLNTEWILSACPFIDGVCRGEGENLAPEYVEGRGTLRNAPTVVNRELLRVLQPAPTLPRFGNELDDYPLPVRDLLPAVLARGELPSVITSRGCGATCSFCAVPAYSGRRWRIRSVESVVGEVRQLHEEYGSNRFHLIDDNLFGHTTESREAAMALLAGLAELPAGLEFRAACRFDDLNDGGLQMLQKAGVRLLKMGVETLGEATQKHYKKLLPEEMVENRLDAVLASGIDVSLGFIMFDPFCSLPDIRRNFEFLCGYRRCWSRHLLRSELAAYAGTAVEKRIAHANLAVSRSAFGTIWRFQNEEVHDFHNRFIAAARQLLLPLEWSFYHVWCQHLERGEAINRTETRVIDGLLRDLGIDLFHRALSGVSEPAVGLERRAKTIRDQIDLLAPHDHRPGSLHSQAPISGELSDVEC